MTAKVLPIHNPLAMPPPYEPETGWAWDGAQWFWCGPHPEHPIWPPCPPRPPMPCPPHHHRPPCGPPSCASNIAKADACWDQSQELTAFLEKVISDIFAQNPGLIPTPPPSAGSGPIIGVTDGSVAAPGEVGEVLSATQTGNFSLGAQGSPPFQTVLSGLTVSAGDWDVQSWLYIAGVTMGGLMSVDPAPPGMIGNMFASQVTYTQVGIGDVGAEQGLTLNSMVTPLSVAQPTLLPISVIVVAGADTPQNGSYALTVTARRMR